MTKPQRSHFTESDESTSCPQAGHKVLASSFRGADDEGKGGCMSGVAFPVHARVLLGMVLMSMYARNWVMIPWYFTRSWSNAITDRELENAAVDRDSDPVQRSMMVSPGNVCCYTSWLHISIPSLSSSRGVPFAFLYNVLDNF